MEWKAVVDRFEDETAVLYYVQEDEEQEDIWFQLPKFLLPQGVKEGDFLNAIWEIDHDLTRQARDRVTSLIDRLVNRNDED